ncbi:adenine-specific DNA-methyltransferase [Pelomonas aquatica]|uniref:site-specific DNA-methyltransferase (adenine-specific) n=1 Tax=Pelomonas aquatica TaxID=431058 RepID=A0ABU1Z6X2_9BURK|nr:Eco57I restriction-modification methylase domain-containing protein [Pelomonas aquatica]MDR7296357.1 adenine-specific DNA-methyltransferase [Pelomonas aquatica]
MTLVDAAHASGRGFTATLSRDEQRAMGQYMTPPTIARFMAQRLVADVQQDHVRVLEPSAGGGILAAAVVEALLAKQEDQRPGFIDLYLFELDARLVPGLEALCHQMAQACQAAGVQLDWRISQEDFLLSELALRGQAIEGLLTISNPPFLKLNKTSDRRAHLHSYAVYGQPNIYSLFMAATARLTPPGGKWCFITPRSWMAGQYFKAARHTMLAHLTIDSLHAFENRREGFEEDSVLQETVIAWASGRQLFEPSLNILLTRSQGASDLDQSQVTAVPTERVVGDDEHVMLSLPQSQQDPFEGWTATLRTYGFEVSTGRVVAFRAAEHIRETASSWSVPLLWLQHVKQQEINWPIRKKREHISATAASSWMLVPNAPMVLMRRFSPKEDARRVTCAPYVGMLPGLVLGLENHLNYIYRLSGRMTPYEARGLSAFLASKVVDEHFRALAGSTQVNATELRKLPLPPLAAIEEIGRKVSAKPSLEEIDEVVNRVLGLPVAAQAAA